MFLPYSPQILFEDIAQEM